MKTENLNMRAFLAHHGIDCTPKRLATGSLKHTWRLTNARTKWTPALASALNRLNFTGFDGAPLGPYSGNGGVLSVFVRGHEELLTAPPVLNGSASMIITEKIKRDEPMPASDADIRAADSALNAAQKRLTRRVE